MGGKHLDVYLSRSCWECIEFDSKNREKRKECVMITCEQSWFGLEFWGAKQK